MNNNQEDIYLTLGEISEGAVYKEKGSKFLAFAYPLESADQVADRLHELRKLHPKAKHWCYAYQTGVENHEYRFNDDGEPNNSAGKPIYGQIQSFDVTNVLIVVVRYFGGTKLGVGGLIGAYRTAARNALAEARIIKKIVKEEMSLRFEYEHMDKIMRVIKENSLDIIDQKMEVDCFLKIAVQKSKLEKVFRTFQELRCAEVKKVN